MTTVPRSMGSGVTCSRATAPWPTRRIEYGLSSASELAMTRVSSTIPSLAGVKVTEIARVSRGVPLASTQTPSTQVDDPGQAPPPMQIASMRNRLRNEGVADEVIASKLTLAVGSTRTV